MKKILKIFKAIGDRNRLRILKILQHKSSRCVCEIGAVLGIGQPTTSRHLKILEDAGLIYSKKTAKWVEYSLVENSHDEKIREIMSLIKEWMNETPEIKEDLAYIDKIDRCIICCGLRQ